jgi:signal transduction histidine kinase
VSERLKDQFITAMSHELRTPMTVIKGMTDLIAEHVEAGTKPDPRLLDTLTRNVDILDRMIVELLDVSELNTEDISVRQDRLALEELLWRVVEGLSPETRRSGLDVAVMLRHPDELYVKGDDQKLRWAMGHLLENSIRYTEPGGHIFFIAGKHDERHVSIQVVDTGVGISDRDLPHIFDQFYRGEPRTPSGKLIDPRGLGQGLYIARRVTEAHGGYLSVKSTPGQGTIFTVVLPAA